MLGDLPSASAKIRANISKKIDVVKQGSLQVVDVTASKLKEGVALKTNNDVGVASTITGYKDSVVTKLDGVIGKLSAGELNTSSISKAIKVDLNGVSFSQDDLISAVGKDLGYDISGTGGVAKTIANEISSEFQKVTGLKLSKIITADGEGFRVNEAWRGELAGEALDNIKKFTGIESFIDTSVVASVRNVVFKNAVKFGMTDSFSKLWDSYPIGFEGFRRDAIIESIESVIDIGDIVSMKKLASLLEAEGKNILLSKYPTLIERLFSKFKFDSDVMSEDISTILVDTVVPLTDLLGENWYKRDTAFGEALDLGIVERLSPDMMTLLERWEELAPLVCCAGMFQEESANVVIRRFFPTAPKFS